MRHSGQGRTLALRGATLLLMGGIVAAAAGCDTGEGDTIPESRATEREAVERPAAEADGASPATEPSDTATAPAAEPVLSVSPAQGDPGTELRIEATGLPPGERIRIGAGPPASEYEIIAETRSDGQGRVDATVSVPSWAEPGDRLVFVAETSDHGTKVLSDPFQVTGPAGASP